ncbi:MAG: hypothetical protein WCN92_10410, partial [Eubacteriales bacterium]
MKKTVLAVGGILTAGILATALLLGSSKAPGATGTTFSDTNSAYSTQSSLNQQFTSSKPSFNEVAKATVKGNLQTVTTSMDGGTYSPIIVQKGIPVKWVG